MKSDIELDRLSARIHYFHGTGQAAEARDHLRRLVNYELADVLDEIQRRADAAMRNGHGIHEHYHEAINRLRSELGLERAACSPMG